MQLTKLEIDELYGLYIYVGRQEGPTGLHWHWYRITRTMRRLIKKRMVGVKYPKTWIVEGKNALYLTEKGKRWAKALSQPLAHLRDTKRMIRYWRAMAQHAQERE